MIKIALITLLYGAFFASVEVISRQVGLPKELSRKLVHIIAGLSAGLLPLFMTFHQIIVLSLIFIPVMLVSKRQNIFAAIHGVSRVTYGEVYFPLAILLTAWLFPHKAAYTYGLLVMGVSDGLASLVGQRYGKKTYHFWATKSYVGSGTFFVSAWLLGLALSGHHHHVLLTLSITAGSALVLAGVEASLSYGLDNLLLAPLAALLFSVSLHW